jgi:hypothetical protein
MTVRRKRVGKDFNAQMIFGPDTGSMNKVDFLDTLKAHQDRKLWTLEGRLRDIERGAAELNEFQRDDRHGRPVHEYADEALAYVELIRREIAAGNNEVATYAALRLGALWRELELKLEHEAAAHTGGRIRPRLAEGRERANLERRNRASAEHQLWQDAADKFFARNPRASLNAAAKHVKVITGSTLAEKTIAQRIEKPSTAL